MIVSIVCDMRLWLNLCHRLGLIMNDWFDRGSAHVLGPSTHFVKGHLSSEKISNTGVFSRPFSRGFATFSVNYLHFTFQNGFFVSGFFFWANGHDYWRILGTYQISLKLMPPGLDIRFLQSLDPFLSIKIMMVSTPFWAHRLATRRRKIKLPDLPIRSSLTALSISHSS